ncbi:MAG: glycosyltransferase [Geminicoccaceae bacterium]
MPEPKVPLRVVHIVQHLVRGGIETMALEMIHQAGPDHQIYVLSLEGNREEALAAWPALSAFGDRLTWLEKPTGISPSSLMRLVTHLRRGRFDCVHTHHIGPLFYGGLAACLAFVPNLVHTEHDAWHLANPKARKLQRLLLKLLRPAYIADTEAVAECAAGYLGQQPVSVIENGVDTERFKPGDKQVARRRLGLPEDGLLIGCAARLERVKGLDVVLSAMVHLDPDVKLMVAGSGSEAEALEAEARALGLADRILFFGAIDDMPTFYRAIDLFCLPSRREGLPMAILEAQASATPVVASAVGGVPNAVDPESGLVVDPENPKALAVGIRAALAGMRGRSARAFIEQTFCAKRMAARYAAFWSHALTVRG